MSAVLEARSVTVRFGGVHALSDFDLEVRPGQLVGLIGPNGAGKTTFVDAATGFVSSSSGQFSLAGDDISGLAPHARAVAGLSRTWQTIEIFDDLTVRENLTVATRFSGWKPMLRDFFGRAHAEHRIDESIALVGLESVADAMPAELSQSQRTLVGVARAIAMQPRVLLLDEPAAGLDVHESAELGRTLRRLVDAGTPMLLIDHDVGLVLSICDYIYVLEFGRLIASGAPAAIRSDPAVVEAYLGGADIEVE